MQKKKYLRCFQPWSIISIKIQSNVSLYLFFFLQGATIVIFLFFSPSYYLMKLNIQKKTHTASEGKNQERQHATPSPTTAE